MTNIWSALRMVLTYLNIRQISRLLHYLRIFKQKLLEVLTALTWISGLAFMYFGISCFYSKFILSEFVRYNLPTYRRLVGFLQLFGAMGLLTGLYVSPTLLLIASVGLSLLMLAGFAVRIHIRDNFVQSSPSLMFAAINVLIAFKTVSYYF